MAKVRYQMFLEAEQKQNLEKIQRDFKISVAEIIRNGLIIKMATRKGASSRSLA